MIKINIAPILLGLCLISSSAFAELTINSKEDVQGAWKLDHTKPNANTKETNKREDSWDFKDGKVTITHIPREGTFYDQSPVPYEVEGGKLKIGILGRSDKFDVFSLVEKDEKSMTLKGKFGDLYFFVRK